MLPPFLMFFCLEETKGKGDKYFEKGYISYVEERKNGEGKGGKYLKKENIWSGSGEEEKERRKRRRRKRK